MVVAMRWYRRCPVMITNETTILISLDYTHTVTPLCNLVVFVPLSCVVSWSLSTQQRFLSFHHSFVLGDLWPCLVRVDKKKVYRFNQHDIYHRKMIKITESQ